MAKNTKKKFAITGAVVLCALVAMGAVLYTNCPKRAVKEALCAESPALCRCYKNVVDYRMNSKDIAITNRYQQEMKKSGFVSPLEFASLEEVQRLNILLNICQMEQAQQYANGRAQQVQQPAPQQQVQQPAPQQVQVQQPVQATQQQKQQNKK